MSMESVTTSAACRCGIQQRLIPSPDFRRHTVVSAPIDSHVTQIGSALVRRRGEVARHAATDHFRAAVRRARCHHGAHPATAGLSGPISARCGHRRSAGAPHVMVTSVGAAVDCFSDLPDEERHLSARRSQAPRRAPRGELMDRPVHHFGRTVSRANNALSRLRISISIATW
jgi:hypothetical protein